jgi:predicted DNA-binding transcriptional regulator YafY
MMSTRLVHRSERLAEIERMLFRSTLGLRVVEIAEACGVDRRTIYRDLSLLTDIGVPIYQKEGRFYLNHEYYVATVRFSVNESLALFIAARGLSHAAEQHNPHVASALKKLSQILPDSLAAHVLYTVEAGHSDPVDRAFISTLETLTRAWAERRQIKLWYRSAESISTRSRDFAIYFIEPNSTGVLYVVGFDYLAQRVRAYKLQRIKRVQLLQNHYEIPIHFDRRRYLAGLWGIMHDDVGEKPVEVVLACSADLSSTIRERAQRAAQRVTVLADNRCVVRMMVADWRELLPWVRSLGAQVEVLEPTVLREQIAAEAAKVAQVYQAKA